MVCDASEQLRQECHSPEPQGAEAGTASLRQQPPPSGRQLLPYLAPVQTESLATRHRHNVRTTGYLLIYQTIVNVLQSISLQNGNGTWRAGPSQCGKHEQTAKEVV